ncbi:hypothetical protein K502DRAFT_359278 [Neoconidiobolus thromboides FSU 785]|nr:hypothetical protein K502DRAFT_359278 [Neoconidiobolus thromboides FSU 785]
MTIESTLFNNQREFILKKATTKQRIQIWKNCYQTWGYGMNEKDYLKLEKKISNSSYSIKNLEYYVLQTAQCNNEINFLTQLETIKRQTYYHHPIHGFKVIDLLYIASIITPEHLRGLGYASKAFELLLPQLTKMGCFGSILYSDIGNFYERYGYKLYSPYQLEITCSDNNKLIILNKNIHFLNQTQVIKLCEWDSLKLATNIKNMNKSQLPEAGLFAVVPSIDNYIGHWETCKLQAKNKKVPLPQYYAAMHQPTTSTDNIQFLIWTYDFLLNQLIVLRHRLIDDHASDLLYHALYIANRFNMNKLVAWNLPLELIRNSSLINEATWIKRKEISLPYAIFPDLNQKDHQPHWCEVQKYTWF